MDDRAQNETTRLVAVLPYEAPVLTPIGTLSELLAGLGSNLCDGAVQQAGPDPISPACQE